jgi:hypothetical protein
MSLEDAFDLSVVRSVIGKALRVEVRHQGRLYHDSRLVEEHPGCPSIEPNLQVF